MYKPINAIRELFGNYKIDAYIVPSNDEYLSEYTPENAKRLQYLTNFTGSNGLLVICKDTALFFTDGRYLDQSRRELDLTIFQIFNIKDITNFLWHNYLHNDSILGYDPKIFTNSKLQIFAKIKSRLSQISDNLVDQIWQDRPLVLRSKIYIHQLEFAGQSDSDKIALCREILTKYSADTMIVTAPDSICWLLNLRASDIPYAPLLLGKVLVTIDQLYLFTDTNRVSQDVAEARPNVTILPEEQFADILSLGRKILVDENLTSSYIMDLLTNKLVDKINDPCQLLKARKNNVEIEHAINFHIKDAIALCEFFAYLFEIPNLQNYSEYDLGEILTNFRAKQYQYVTDSFPIICGFKENSAIIHYRATKLQAKKIDGNGILLIDSGGQYRGCTTDVTRSFAIGRPTKEQKLRYTQVLKGHIAISMIKFPANITGSHLDVLARQFLWRDQQDYPHGTGHGVGSFLSVHEGPQNISVQSKVVLEAGMILSNEPGYYQAGQYGIRIENLMYVKNMAKSTIATTDSAVGQESAYLEFATLTLVPYAKELIDNKMLNQDEKNYIKQYYHQIKQQVYPLLSVKAKNWLDDQLFLL